MNPKAEETLKRIKNLIKGVVGLVNYFPKTTASFKIAGQIADSATSILAGYYSGITFSIERKNRRY